MHRRIVSLAGVVFLAVLVAQAGAADVQSLAGQWRFSMDGPQPGRTQEALPRIGFADTIELPGTTETRGKGKENAAREAGRLTRIRRFDGAAWYQRDVTIPESWKGKRISLLLERTKYAQVWLDDKPIGESAICCTPQVYLLGDVAPGPHRLTIAVDNRAERRAVRCEAHQYSDNTQTNWNGIIGLLQLRATGPVWIDDVQVYPDLAKRSVRVRIAVGNATGRAVEGSVALAAKSWNVAKAHEPAGASVKLSAVGKLTTIEAEYVLGPDAQLWDEFSPALYRLSVQLDTNDGQDRREVDFGLRQFTTKSGQFTINGRPTFLRGKHDGCVFPLTGHPPMDVAGWMTYLQICKDYGINHIRCHTWTPPEAALSAADRLGIYFQPELPFWGAFNAKVRDGLMPEAQRILKDYGNHPSFVMFSLGNEPVR